MQPAPEVMVETAEFHHWCQLWSTPPASLQATTLYVAAAAVPAPIGSPRSAGPKSATSVARTRGSARGVRARAGFLTASPWRWGRCATAVRVPWLADAPSDIRAASGANGPSHQVRQEAGFV